MARIPGSKAFATMRISIDAGPAIGAIEEIRRRTGRSKRAAAIAQACFDRHSPDAGIFGDLQFKLSRGKTVVLPSALMLLLLRELRGHRRPAGRA
jgi:hypothetical protein